VLASTISRSNKGGQVLSVKVSPKIVSLWYNVRRNFLESIAVPPKASIWRRLPGQADLLGADATSGIGEPEVPVPVDGGNPREYNKAIAPAIGERMSAAFACSPVCQMGCD